MIFRRLLILLVILPSAAPMAHPAAQSPIPAIVCFGNSITAGYGVDPGHSYPDYLQADLNALGYHYKVINQGISGNTTKDAVGRLDNVIQLHPAIVIVELGGNDGLRGLPPAATRSNLDTIVGTLRKSGIKVVLAGITLPPNYGPDYIRQFNAIFPEVAAKNHVTLLPMLYAHVYDVPNAIQEDGIHPTAKGAQLIAANMRPLLLPLLHK